MTNFDPTYSGRGYRMQNGEVYTLGQDGKMRWAGAYTGASTVVILTGYTYTTEAGNLMHQTESGGWIDLKHGWEYVRSVTKYNSQAQAVVNTIIRNNQRIVQHNILCARFSDKLTADEKKTLYGLQQRLTARNEALMSDGLLTDVKADYPAGYVYLEEYLSRFMASGGVGVATWVVVVVAATVIASLSTACYFAYRHFASESEQDVKYSDELTRTLLSKLTDEEYQQLLNETKGIVTKARIRQSLSNYTGILSYALIGLGAAMLYKLINR